MGIDTSMYNALKPVQIDSPIDAYGKIAQFQQMQNQNRLADLVFGEKQREAEQANTFNQLYKNAVGADGKFDRSAILKGAAQSGLGSKIPGLQKSFIEADEAQGKVDKQRVELIDAKLKQSRAYLENVTTPEQYLAWHEANHKDPILGPELAARGVTVEQARASIMAALSKPGGFEELLNKSRLGIEKFTEMNKPTFEKVDNGGHVDLVAVPGMGGAPSVLSSTKKVQSPDSIASNAVAMRGQNMTDARAREANGKGQYDSERGVLVDPRTGVARQVIGADGQPLGAKDSKPSTEYLKQAEAYRNMDDAITGYKSVLSKFDTYDSMNPAKRAELNTAYNNAMLQAKEIYRLGVLNGPDERIITSIIKNPLDLTSAIVPKEALLKQAGDLQEIIKRNNENLAKVNKQPVMRLKSESVASASSATPAAGARKTIGTKTYENDGNGWYEVK